MADDVSRATTLGAVGGGDLAAAAAIIADGARTLAAAWSARIPGNISVEVSGNVATISADVGPARPNKLNLRHPLFGNRGHWYPPGPHGSPGRPFLAPAADARAGAAMQRYAQKIDKMVRAAGF